MKKEEFSVAVAVLVAMKSHAFCKQVRRYINEFSRMARFTNDDSLLFPVARNWNIKAIRELKLVSIKSFVHCKGNCSILCILLEWSVSSLRCIVKENADSLNLMDSFCFRVILFDLNILRQSSNNRLWMDLCSF